MVNFLKVMFIHWSTIWKDFSTTVILGKPFAHMMEMRHEKYTAWSGFVGCDLNFDLVWNEMEGAKQHESQHTRVCY